MIGRQRGGQAYAGRDRHDGIHLRLTIFHSTGFEPGGGALRQTGFHRQESGDRAGAGQAALIEVVGQARDQRLGQPSSRAERAAAGLPDWPGLNWVSSRGNSQRDRAFIFSISFTRDDLFRPVETGHASSAVPPGRARLETRPVPTGSPAVANTIGMVVVTCFAARTGGVVWVIMTSTLSRTNSAAISAKRSLRPSAHRTSISTLRPYDPTKFAQPLHEGAEKSTVRRWRDRPQEPDGRQLCRLLRARRERPRRCRDERDEVAPFHCPVPPVLPTERIAHLGRAGD
jgi:hypothetical protein